MKAAGKILRVLHELMIDYVWFDIEDDILTRVLSIYYHSIHPTPDDEQYYPPIRKGMELVLRAMFENFSNFHLMKSVNQVLYSAVSSVHQNRCR